MSYNGHKNWNHWNVALWIGNDYGLYSMARDYIDAAKHQCCQRPKDAAAEAMRDSLHEMGHTHTPDGAPYSKTAIRAAMVGL